MTTKAIYYQTLENNYKTKTQLNLAIHIGSKKLVPQWKLPALSTTPFYTSDYLN